MSTGTNNSSVETNQGINDDLKLIDDLKSQLRCMVDEMKMNEKLTDEDLKQYELKTKSISIQLSALSQIVLTTNNINESFLDVSNNKTARMMKLIKP